ncbi:MAG: hypothetical protein D6736_09990 [Nitrospinota bacterium]|nr:MAG: hypothetical protein D6736_09990 [Nitrospinota bacterium]
MEKFLQLWQRVPEPLTRPAAVFIVAIIIAIGIILSFRRKLPDAVVRLAIVAVILIGVVLFIRIHVIPPALKETGFQRASAIAREISKNLKYAGADTCTECHEEEYQTKREGHHRNLSCETCHGPAQAHADDPSETRPPAPRERKFCPLCHTYNPSRPTGFPQINPRTHNPLEPCITCHSPHDPEPPEVPRACEACHAEIVRTKAVSPHAPLECTTCHTVPDEHKVTPRSVRPSKPEQREFCGKCHRVGTQDGEIPKIDLATHGERYLCWQCHYPHMPEAR